MPRKYRLATLGCKVNQYESQQIRETLEDLGLQPARVGENADLAVVNTCAVTTTAASKSRQSIRRISCGGRVPTVVVGCYATAAAETLQRIPGVIAVLGHPTAIGDELRSVLSRWLEASTGLLPGRPMPAPGAAGGRNTVRDEVRMTAESGPLPPSGTPATDTGSSHSSIPTAQPSVNGGAPHRQRIHRFDGHQRAFLKVQDGCDAACTYCIIPRLRPRLDFKPIPQAVEEARDLVRAGHREIVVTGIYLGAYGRTTSVRRRHEGSDSPLADLVEALAAVAGLTRLRLSSLEPSDVDDRLLSVLRRHDCCVRHLHLPLQSGSNAILRWMNRQYTAAEYLHMIERARETLDRPAISTDIVVGFPGESEADFEATLDLARRSGFFKIHAFPFSPRPGTAAARWTDRFVPPAVVRERLHRLGALERELAGVYLRGLIGSMERVIVEASPNRGTRSLRGNPGRGQPPATGHGPLARENTGGKSEPQLSPPGDGDSLRHGRSDRYFEIFFDAPDVVAGDIVHVRIDRVTPGRVHGTLVYPTRPCPLPM